MFTVHNYLLHIPYIRVFFRGNLIFAFLATVFNSRKIKHAEIIFVIVCHIIFMFPKRSLGNILFLLCFLLLLLFFFFFSGTFLSGNVLKNYWRDQYETFQDDSLAFVDVPNDSHFF